MEEIYGIPELSGFAIPTTVDELEEIVALLPDAMRLAATPDKPHIIAINRQTREIAISRPCAPPSKNKKITLAAGQLSVVSRFGLSEPRQGPEGFACFARALPMLIK